jgi:hypothetical protein
VDVLLCVCVWVWVCVCVCWKHVWRCINKQTEKNRFILPLLLFDSCLSTEFSSIPEVGDLWTRFFIFYFLSIEALLNQRNSTHSCWFAITYWTSNFYVKQVRVVFNRWFFFAENYLQLSRKSTSTCYCTAKFQHK